MTRCEPSLFLCIAILHLTCFILIFNKHFIQRLVADELFRCAEPFDQEYKIDDQQCDSRADADAVGDRLIQAEAFLSHQDIGDADRGHKGSGKGGDQRAEAVFALFEQVGGRDPQGDHREGLVAP